MIDICCLLQYYNVVVITTYAKLESIMVDQHPMKNKKNDTQSRLIQSVDRAINILKCLASEPKGVPLMVLSKKLDLPPQTLNSLLRTLQFHNLVQQMSRGEPYQLGSGLYQLTLQWTANQDRVQLARETVFTLAQTTGENVTLAELRGMTVFSIVEAQSNQPLRVSSECRSFAHIHVLATGKLLLAYQSEDRLEAILNQSPLIKVASKTITSPAIFRRNLARIRQQGYAVTIDEGADGVAAIAVPVHDLGGQVIAALGISMPTVRMTSDRQGVLLGALQRSASQIEKQWSMKH